MTEILLKKIDILRDEIKWWRNMFLIIISTFIGGIISISQNKLILNFVEIIIGIVLFMALIFSMIKVKQAQTEQYKLFDKLRRNKWK